MNVIVAVQQHFNRAADGVVYADCIFDYAFWCRYKEVFDEVIVFARVDSVKKVHPSRGLLKSSGPGVKFFSLPDYLGPWQYLKCRRTLKALARQVLQNKDACILRVPGQLGTLLYSELIKAERPYGVEVVGDAWDSLSPGSVKTVLRPIARRKADRDLARQCHRAVAASYVTERSLQKRYPPGGWSTYYSSIELPAEAIVDDRIINERLERIDRKSASNDSWSVCYAGSLNQLYKAPDILLSAVGQCIKKGVNLKLTMLGDGQFRAMLEQQAKELGIYDRVKFMGMLPSGKAVYEQLDKADLYVMPSRQEGLPRSVIEAMARGLVCIGSNVGGFPELLESEYMVNPQDVSGLSDKITAVVSDVSSMKKAVRRNVKIAVKYRSDILHQRRVEFYTRVKDVTFAWLERKNK